ncbi:MAG: hypothetical protein A2887_03260 [Alphaproteobacteria bacterium RIFCSPLOWO2_01_FULL_40_26]|nr:MAG: hypothetical protein A3D15_01360 [Alphaproteobacteria bacterium RIFCSPHIGHO2_02_FULL_40_34]OFW88776.1 MAG: hypothetical protein A2794_01175 [Alphaproteobacteria bacterium RIFCSPHIGHO2_01_FULL_40_8]OFW94507.1 MAG: hypothetical protein A2887_03260 [Alphaproteobacteria bacterium RIFCSPLOWO2_01_FULL_40_26]OFX10215.1 MAG: hypothetical protein A3H30_04185 [Alphaproteobacteria bacterium RIFCSPLOWO2_02_FULL_40_19]OFX11299.1 MAG: hypothetical protein A3G22_06140 [Alphaproteobacteria bacterium RI
MKSGSNIKINQERSAKKGGGLALFNLGFRPFFLGAAIFSVLSTTVWLLVYLFEFPVEIEVISQSQWHAHEMLYGYAMAVVVGFLLTAIKNWTGVQTVHGKPLAFLFALWFLARLALFFGTSFLSLAAVFDIAFNLLAIALCAYPIIKAKQWQQSFILSKLLFLLVGNVLFYLEAFGIFEDGARIGLYAALYLMIAIILTIGRRVMPFFIERGVGYPVTLSNSKWLDVSSMLLFLGFFIFELIENQKISSFMALCLFLVNAIRLAGWYTPGIWKKSLLWSIYLSFWLICFGFLLFVVAYFFDISKFLAVHAFAIGGIGLMTIGMMSRVALGHTGRDVGNPHKAMSYAFISLILVVVLRVILPLFDVIDYELLIGLSHLLWLISFVIFISLYFSILTHPRVDGASG